MDFSQTDAQVLIGFISSVVVPFIISYIKNPRWPDWVKLTVALIVCLGAGALTVYATGGLSTTHVVIALVSIFTAAQVNYKTWFTGLGLEQLLAPQGPLVPEQVKAEEHTSRIYPGTPQGG